MSSEHYYALPIDYCLRQFVLKRQLGQGNFGLTYLAWDKNLDRWVAIKELLPLDFAFRARDGVTVVAKSPSQEAGLSWARARFLEEARTLAKLPHPAIVQVYEQFEANSTAYLVMEYIEGEDLEEWLRKNSNPGEEKLKGITCKILQALQIVHRNKYLHRDIKPDNIRIRKDSLEPVLIDFGNARMATGLKTSNLSAIVAFGYAPFEQYQITGKQGPWTDAYALGAVLYRAIVGKVPPPATDRHGEDTIIRLAQDSSIKGYSPAFLGMIDKALRLRADERWQTCGAWLAAIPGGETVNRPPFPWNKALFALLSVLVIGAGFAFWTYPSYSPKDDKKEFTNTSGSKDYEDGIKPIPIVPLPLISIEQPSGYALSHGQGVVDFGRPSINTTVARAFVIRNIGQADLSGLSISKDGSSDFSVASLNTTSVAAGKLTEFTVNFAPHSSDSQKATLHVTSNSSGGKSPFDINLTGGGVGTPDISIEQDGKVLADNSSALNFGSATVGAASELKFTVKSIGDADLAGLAANVDGAAAKDYTVSALSSGAIAPGRTAAFSVIFKPSSSGERSATLHIASNASGPKNPFDLSFNGSGQMPQSPTSRPEPPKQPIVEDAPITNSIGMIFAPVHVTDLGADGRPTNVGKLLFSLWETRVCDIGQWKPAYLKAGNSKDAVSHISDVEAKGFCDWLSAKEKRKYRLPTDHEWSCAAGLHENSSRPWNDKHRENLKVFPWSGTGSTSPQDFGRYSLHLFKPGQRPKAPPLEVGFFKPNAFGLFDMGGNVFEWCIDQNSPDTVLLRGGSWATAPYEKDEDSDNAFLATLEARKFEPFSLARRESSAGPEADEIGFRCVLEP